MHEGAQEVMFPKQLFLLVLSTYLVLITSCGPSLKQMKETSPVSKTVRKDAFCVYSKLNGQAIMKQTCALCAKLIWNSNWDPVARRGTVFAQVSFYDYFPIMFDVYAVNGDTVIEKRVPEHYLTRYRKIADDIFNNTDYSGCPDSQ